jgi:hypothetical protein
MTLVVGGNPAGMAEFRKGDHVRWDAGNCNLSVHRRNDFEPAHVRKE